MNAAGFGGYMIYQAIRRNVDLLLAHLDSLALVRPPRRRSVWKRWLVPSP